MNYFTLSGTKGRSNLNDFILHFISKVESHYEIQGLTSLNNGRHDNEGLKNVTVYIIKTIFNISQKPLSYLLGYKDRTGVGYAVQKVKGCLDNNVGYYVDTYNTVLQLLIDCWKFKHGGKYFVPEENSQPVSAKQLAKKMAIVRRMAVKAKEITQQQPTKMKRPPAIYDNKTPYGIAHNL